MFGNQRNCCSVYTLQPLGTHRSLMAAPRASGTVLPVPTGVKSRFKKWQSIPRNQGGGRRPVIPTWRMQGQGWAEAWGAALYCLGSTDQPTHLPPPPGGASHNALLPLSCKVCDAALSAASVPGDVAFLGSGSCAPSPFPKQLGDHWQLREQMGVCLHHKPPLFPLLYKPTMPWSCFLSRMP